MLCLVTKHQIIPHLPTSELSKAGPCIIELLFQLSFLILVPINIIRWPLPWYHIVVKISTSNRVFDPVEEEKHSEWLFQYY